MPCKPEQNNSIPAEEKCIQVLFAEQVHCSPDAIALVLADEQLTYAQLDARANALAQDLCEQGVGPESIVAICCERSLEMIVGLLGILKAGGAYLPIDPSTPAERRSFMLADGQVSLVLTQEHLKQKFTGEIVQVLTLDRDALMSGAVEPLDIACSPANLAYVMYTSGSTGVPKGVSVTHRSVVRLVKEANYAQFGAGEVFLQAAPLSFDASTFEIWGSLLNGGRLVLMQGAKASLAHLAEAIRRYQITTLWLTAGLFHQMVESELESLRGLKQLLAGGDVLSVPHVEQVARELPCQLINGYGPTENTTFTCCYRVPAGETMAGNVPIGLPLANTFVHILDEQMQPVSFGEAGELYTGGDGLARGYLNDSALTAERFVPNPFSETGERLYRTGDRARYRADGNIEFLGRIDHQVKVRGYRIEPVEIETALTQHPAVKQCAVLALPDQSGGKRLVAYLVQNSEATAEQLEGSHVSQWRRLYDDTYQASAGAAPEFNITGWNSSYTGRPIPMEEMREWVDCTVARVLKLAPRRVLEIGCGTGLLLLRIAPHCESYHGTDFSRQVIDQLSVTLKESATLENVQLSHREANDFSGLEPDSVDLVILNSVVQYFPSVDYLVKVIEGAVRVIRPGGVIFFGDVRNLDLLAAFHASVQLHKAAPSLPVTEYVERVRQAIAAEDELVIAPAFFEALNGTLPKSCVAHPLPKRGHSQNELTKFRYDVILEVVPQPSVQPALQWLDVSDAKDVHSALLTASSGELAGDLIVSAFGLSGVPNARVLPEVGLAERLNVPGSERTVKDLRANLQAQAVAGIDPEELWSWATANSFAAHFSLVSRGPAGSYDVALSKRREGGGEHETWPAPRSPAVSERPLNELVNQRSSKTSYGTIVAGLRDFLSTRLPEYMMPSAFVFMDNLPLTNNGKVDRNALPAPEQSRPNLEQEFLAPRDETETSLARIWAEVLGIDRIGVLDNFFELGGHSLLATQVCARLRELFQANVALQDFFSLPTVAGLATLITKADQQTTLRTIDHQTNTTAARLSSGQQRLWFMNQLAPGTPVHNIPAAIPLDQRPDIGALERALNEIVRRQASLRTTINGVAGQSQQIIAPQLKLPLLLIDLTRLSLFEAEHESERIKNEEAHTPFDLHRGPLIRSKLIRLSEHRHILLLTMHHIISDGWSMGVLLRELGILYQAFSEGRESPLPELPIQYSDFSAWQHEQLAGPSLSGQLAYWRDKLSGATGSLQLPTDRARPPRQSFRGERLTLELPAQLSKQVNEFSQHEGVTLFMTLLASFNLLLHRWSGQDDINVGTPIVNRPHSDTEGLIGFFLNTLVLRTKFTTSTSFRELLEQVKETCLGAYANRDVPFEMLVEQLNPQRDLSRSPLFQVFFNLLNFSDQRLELPGLTRQSVSPVSVWSQPDQTWSQFDMTLYASQQRASQQSVDRLRLILVYNSDLFNRTRMTMLLEQFRAVLAQVVSHPHEPLEEYSLVTPESRPLLPDPTEPIAQPQLRPITEEFFERAATSPEHPAICRGSASRTYGELAVAAKAIARFLSHAGLQPGEVVALIGRPGFELIAGMLGVLAGRGVLLLLDPNLPPERLRLMLGESRCHRVLQVGDEDIYSWLSEVPQLTVTNIAKLDPQAASATVLPSPEPDEPAYLFFTSGTTGVPKGVLGCHKGLSHFLTWQREEFKVTQADRAAQLTGLSFDVVLRDILLPLTSGASLHVPDDPAAITSGRLLLWLERERSHAVAHRAVAGPGLA